MKVKSNFKFNSEISFDDYMSISGVEDMETYLKASTVEDDSHYNGIDTAVSLIEQHKDKIVLLADCDVDGYMSASMTYKALKKKYPNIEIETLLHSKNPKAHGLDIEIMQLLSLEEPSLIWIPDAGTNDIKQCRKLANKGWDILITDHHEQSGEMNEYATVVNNQTSKKVKNKYGSGCLVTWHVIHALDSKIANGLIDYVMVSLIGDSMNLSSNENYTFVNRGKKKISTALMRFIYAFNKGGTNTDYSFGCISRINACIRLGSYEDKELLFNALCNDDFDTEEIVSNLKGLHSLQKKEVERILGDIDIDDSKNYILAEIKEKTPLTGLIANKIMSKYNKSTLLVHTNQETGVMAGSVRSNVDNFRTMLSKSGLFDYNSGHEKIFGTAFQIKNMKSVIKFLDSLEYKESTEEVLASYDINSIPKSLWNLKQKIDEYDVLGRGMPNAKIHIKPFCINGKDIEQLGNGATLKYTYNGISFMFFFMGEDKRKELHVGERYKYKLELIGELNVNEYNGKLTNQIMVDKYEIIEYNSGNWEDDF